MLLIFSTDFEDSCKTPLRVIVLYGIDRLLDYVATVGAQFSNVIYFSLLRHYLSLSKSFLQRFLFVLALSVPFWITSAKCFKANLTQINLYYYCIQIL
ncbi:hypothetical protein AAZX31_13G223000 [Glycine max]